MEIYDIYNNSYSLVNITFPYNYAVSVIIDDRIYVINSEHYKIISKELEIIEEGIYIKCSEPTKLLGNVAVYKDCICFYNQEFGKYEIRNTKTMSTLRYDISARIHNKFDLI